MLGRANFSVDNIQSKSTINNITIIPAIKISSYNTFKFAYLEQKVSEKELEINKKIYKLFKKFKKLNFPIMLI